jgi:NADH-quinone oxidoreductase subunit F
VIFSVVGDVRYPGLIEIPTGVTLKQLIFDICGGMPGKPPFKAVQIGGPSGGCLPERFLDTPIDYDSLTKAGAMMGSGGMVVMDERTCMVDVALFFMGFIHAESCGKCTFCRIGTAQLHDILRRITMGQGQDVDLVRLKELSEEIQQGSLCALGRTAPNPVLTTLAYFHDEYAAHIREKRCPACMCRELTAFYIDRMRCSRGCDACRGSCPVDAIFNDKKKIKNIDQQLCVKCGECLVVCPEGFNAVKKISPGHLAPTPANPASATGAATVS